jgi:hypothetical protein
MMDQERLLDMLTGCDDLPEGYGRRADGARGDLRRLYQQKAARCSSRPRALEELVSESYIVKEAVDRPMSRSPRRGQATRIRLEAEDYSEQAFESTETVLTDLLGQVRRFRTELHQARTRRGVTMVRSRPSGFRWPTCSPRRRPPQHRHRAPVDWGLDCPGRSPAGADLVLESASGASWCGAR